MKALIFLALTSALLLSFSGKQIQAKNPPTFKNVLTPNGDGKNDVFTIDFLEEYPNNQLLIHSRWGNVVYESSPYKGNWDGRCSTCKKKSDLKLPEGAYVYVFTDNDTGTKYNGHFEIIY